VVTALAVAVILLTGGGGLLHGNSRAAVAAVGPAVADQIVYTARTANDAAITLPGVVQDELVKAGQAHESVGLTRVGYSGDVATSDIDMTPRTGDSSRDPVLNVAGRALPVIEAKASGIQAAVDSPEASGDGSRALFAGLTRTDFLAAPLTIISSGMDLANPDDFRSLNWSVPPAEVAAKVKRSGDMPQLHGPVTFVMVPTAGPQPQLGQEQKAYIKAVWTALLEAAGATSVTFIDANTAPGSAAPSAPTVAVPSLPTTPIVPVHVAKNKVTCTVTDSFFVFDSAALINAAQTAQDLTACVTTALAAHASITLDGWASYEGPLNSDGKPEYNYPANIELSDQRVTTIADLLVSSLDVPRSDITRMTGHGNVDQPNANPRSAANRVVVIAYTIK
jgi:outer membrane protein OmpA-like peptidoglycan-associated protein